MSRLRILTPEGDQTVVWNRERVKLGDPETLDAVREAERIFEEHRRKGATAFLTKTDAPAVKLDRFDPEAEQIIMVPRVQGG